MFDVVLYSSYELSDVICISFAKRIKLPFVPMLGMKFTFGNTADNDPDCTAEDVVYCVKEGLFEVFAKDENYSSEPAFLLGVESWLLHGGEVIHEEVLDDHSDVKQKILELQNSLDTEALPNSLQKDNPVKNLNTPEPEPITSTSRPVWEMVIDDMKDRDQTGRKKYGTPLQAGNGRDALVDAYQEALDLCVYLRQAIEERAT